MPLAEITASDTKAFANAKLAASRDRWRVLQCLEIDEHRVLSGYLAQRDQVSLRSTSDDHFRKILLLSAASYFEARVKDCIVEFVGECASNSEPVIEFVKNKAIERQYHSFFPVILGDLSPIRLGAIFVSPDSCIAASASPPGQAVEVEGGYRVKGRFAWASGVHQARWVVANCFVFDGDQMRKSAVGTPVALGLVMPKQDCNVLDTWHVLGMRGTGSTEFEVDGAFVPKDMAIRFFGADSQHPHPIFHLPPTYFATIMSAS
jgi:hypothetical protein